MEIVATNLIVLEMFFTRGYEYEGKEYTCNKMGLMQFWKKKNARLVYFVDPIASVKTCTLDSMMDTIKLFDSKSCFILYTDTFSPTAKARISKLDVTIEVRHVNEFMCNITKHVLQPQVQKCSNKQAAHVKSLFKYLMPRYNSLDPVVLFHAWEKGQVIAICHSKCGHGLNERGACCDDTEYRLV
jgi:hypothetical protein